MTLSNLCFTVTSHCYVYLKCIFVENSDHQNLESTVSVVILYKKSSVVII